MDDPSSSIDILFFLTIKYDVIMEYHQKEELSDEFATVLYGLHPTPTNLVRNQEER
jgi:hypothetical protein